MARLTLELPANLVEALRRKAFDNHRYLKNEILVLLEAGLAASGMAPLPGMPALTLIKGSTKVYRLPENR
jgi:hypothetical protein